jgi:hypothetical protein
MIVVVNQLMNECEVAINPVGVDSEGLRCEVICGPCTFRAKIRVHYIYAIVGEKPFSWTQNPPPAKLCEFDFHSENQEINWLRKESVAFPVGFE